MTREAFLLRLRLMGTTMLAVFAASVLFGATLGAGFSLYNAYASIGTAALIGLPLFTFEAFFVNSALGAGFRRWPFSRFVAARCAVWLAWIFVATQLSRGWLWSTEEALWAGTDMWWTIAFSFTVSLVVVSALTLNRLIGPGVFRNLLLGRYHSPTEERRALLFIDLADSTAIAERIGATRFLALMNEFVYDIDAALEGSGGAIYRYVGDEAIITWRLDETRDLSVAVEFVFRLRTRIVDRGEEYRKTAVTTRRSRERCTSFSRWSRGAATSSRRPQCGQRSQANSAIGPRRSSSGAPSTGDARRGAARTNDGAGRR